ncbi:MAG: ribonuclease P protein component [Acidimicrobiia bacterium]|nr:ribonuclease P protein component [Acidimicrobiia bacterium]
MRDSTACARGPLAVRRGPGVACVGYAVGRNVGGAVVRNRLRRRLREAARLHVDRAAIDATYLVIARPGAERLSFEELSALLVACLDELRKRR